MTNTWIRRIQQAHVRVFGRAPQGAEWLNPSTNPEGGGYRRTLRTAVEGQLKLRWQAYLDGHEEIAGPLAGVPVFKPGF